jgi:hypothetical protein
MTSPLGDENIDKLFLRCRFNKYTRKCHSICHTLHAFFVRTLGVTQRHLQKYCEVQIQVENDPIIENGTTSEFVQIRVAPEVIYKKLLLLKRCEEDLIGGEWTRVVKKTRKGKLEYRGLDIGRDEKGKIRNHIVEKAQ